MMLERYRAATREVRGRLTKRITKMLGVREPRGRDGLFRALDAAGLCQADLVLCLLRLNALREAEELVGKKIKVCPPCLKVIAPPLSDAYQGDKRRIVRLAPNPCPPLTGAYLRYKILRLGMTVEQARRRGVKRRDLRVWGRKHFVEVESRAG